MLVIHTKIEPEVLTVAGFVEQKRSCQLDKSFAFHPLLEDSATYETKRRPPVM